MAEDDKQWPSEDEDFDAVSDGKPVAIIDEPKEEESQPVKTSATSVKVVDHDEPEPEEVSQEEESAPESAQPAEPETTDEPVPAEAAAHDEPAAEPETIPEQQFEAPAEPIAAPPKAPKAPKNGMGRTVLEVVLCLAVVGLGLWSWTLYSDNKDLKKQVSQLNANPQSVIQKQTQSLITQVGKLIDLPKGETPTIANVSDAAQAKQQSAFFNNAQNGDRVLMYVKAGEAILYRPSTNKIILVAPLTFTNNTGNAPSTTTTPKTSSTTSH